MWLGLGSPLLGPKVASERCVATEATCRGQVCSLRVFDIHGTLFTHVLPRDAIYIPEFDEYLEGSSPYKTKGHVSSVRSWWVATGCCGAQKELVRLAVRFAALRASSADVEPNLSTLSMVYGKNRVHV